MVFHRYLGSLAEAALKQFIVVLASVLMLLSSRPALAWNSVGHMSVAYAAYQELSSAERARVAVLLQLNPYYTRWLSYIPADASTTDRDLYVFMMAATWPDEIKAMGSHYVGNNDPPSLETADLNVGYEDHGAHKYWHYVNIRLGGTGADSGPPAGPNVVHKISVFRTALAGDIPDGVKSYDLVWLIHLVGDIHQPLHCTTRISALNPKGDQGGNAVVVNGPAKELHAYWDNALGEGETRNFMSAVKAGKALPTADPELAKDVNEADWAAESYALAKSSVYVDPVGAGLGPYTLGDDYAANTQKIAAERVSLAGARLASLIKTALQCDETKCLH